MPLVRENRDEFDRNNSRYKQFKVRNTRRTSTPQPLVRPKYIRRNILCDLQLPPVHSPPQPPSKCGKYPDVDTAYVSYVQWRHYLVVPNSVRKFKVRCTGTDTTMRSSDTNISGNINMLPVCYAPASVQSSPLCPSNRFDRFFAFKSKKTATVEDILNSPIAVVESNLAEYREHLDRRNQRIINMVVPMIKKSLKRFFAGEPGRNVEPVKSKSARILKSLNPLHRRAVSEDRECLLDYYDGVEVEE